MLRFEEFGGVLAFAIWVFAIIDCITAEYGNHLGKQVWLPLVIFVPPIGPLLWLILGRPSGSRPRQVRAGPAFTDGVPKGLPPRHLRGGPVAPDDDPRFLTSLDESAQKQARLDAWEADLARRERELRRGDDPVV